jgi:hypothetical protein
MEVEEIKSSRGKAALYLLISLAFVTISVATPSESAAERYMLWLGGAFFGLCSVVLASLLIRPQRLLLAPMGFTVAGGLVGAAKQVLWRDVSPLFVVRSAMGVKMIGFNFAPGAREDSTLIRVNRFVGAEGALPKGWPISPERMVERINAYRAQALAEIPASGAGAA